MNVSGLQRRVLHLHPVNCMCECELTQHTDVCDKVKKSEIRVLESSLKSR